jgi:hypothetical protein
VHREDAHLAFDAGQHDHLHVLTVGAGLRV